MTRCIIEDDVTLVYQRASMRAVEPVHIADMTLRVYADGGVTLSIGHTEIDVTHDEQLVAYADKRVAEELQAIRDAAADSEADEKFLGAGE